ncbi:phosphoadenosine phosphosulfate sulfotransferase [Eggerthella guodeyinii]|uniref:Phosphoadenosine phosphosulfate sulfotransferase n=1 Tax=Eggerthella guodeyinii TaxID=2690837 RepID=A0A6L7INA5_9ACTN|nr:phosphoadenosine phosphosulfate sulfotransferase [Eggerthella guodeyinii]QOS68307.1 phosphoadenosine phosphosulfate sulfotransferase [Eggerthella guodeyinii]
MRKLGESINELMTVLAAGDDASRKAQRAAAVNVAWRNAVEAVYKDAAEMVLDHVNAVYIMAADEVVKGAPTKASHTGTGAQLVVYSDDSLIRSDLDARQEFLKMKLKEQGEHVETFKILPSRFDMKSRHPFRRAEAGGGGARPARPVRDEAPRVPLTPEEQAALEASVDAVESPTVRRALERAIRADKNRM